MKTRKYFKNLISGTMAILLLTLMYSCDTMNPSAPQVTDAKIQQDNQNVKILNFGLPQTNLKKITSVSKWMTALDGGWEQLFHVGEDTTDLMFVYSLINIRPNTMSADAEIGLTVDDQNFAGAVDVEFAPHGITFSEPALLTMYAYGLDLSGVDVNNLNFYYQNTETGLWEPMVYQYLYVSVEYGIIYLLNGELPHFSRYAIGTE